MCRFDNTPESTAAPFQIYERLEMQETVPGFLTRYLMRGVRGIVGRISACRDAFS